MIETGVYLREASIQGYTILYKLPTFSIIGAWPMWPWLCMCGTSHSVVNMPCYAQKWMWMLIVRSVVLPFNNTDANVQVSSKHIHIPLRTNTYTSGEWACTCSSNCNSITTIMHWPQWEWHMWDTIQLQHGHVSLSQKPLGHTIKIDDPTVTTATKIKPVLPTRFE